MACQAINYAMLLFNLLSSRGGGNQFQYVKVSNLDEMTILVGITAY